MNTDKHRTVIIFDEKKDVSEIADQKGNAVLLPFPNFKENEQTATREALKIAYRMRADTIVIYREI